MHHDGAPRLLDESNKGIKDQERIAWWLTKEWVTDKAKQNKKKIAQSARAIEYTDCISLEK